MQFKLNKTILKKLQSLNMTVEDYFSLYIYNTGYKITYPLKLDNLKELNILDKNDLITDHGKEVWKLLSAPTSKLSTINNFEEWWNTYPSTDKHSNYPDTYRIKSSICNLTVPYTQNCFSKYEEILDSGITQEELINALKAEVNSKKINSSKENKLKYMPKPYKYLLNHMYEMWLGSEVSDSLPNEHGKAIT